MKDDERDDGDDDEACDEPEPYTAEEVREQFIAHVRALARYWSRQGSTDLERCEGVAFSILSTIDGCSAGLPSFDLVARPHPKDKDYNIEEGNRWYEDGQTINADCHLHELLVTKKPKQHKAKL